jgi:sulfite oxidase
MHPTNINRRQWLATSGAIAISTCSLPSLAFAQQDEKQLNMLTSDPRNGQPAMEDLVESWITPVKHFYVRSHAPNPVINPSEFRVSVTGKVRKPLSLSLEELAQMKRIKTTATMTCAGNRRIEFNAEKKVGGVQWGAGAIGNANWSGISLADVLSAAEVLEDARHVWFEGLDQIQRPDGIIPFGASIPIEKAMINDGAGTVLLCDQMNGQALTPDHGYPLRTVVPGYIGARSVKWLGKIVVSDRPSPNHYVATAYKIVHGKTAMDWNEAGPIYRFPINAAVCSPSSDSAVAAGKTTVSGYVLPTGVAGNKVKAVHVSIDNGKKWKQAKIQNDQNEFCWSLWKVEIDITKSTTEIVVRAQDTSGGFMPFRVPWNAKGYLQNSWFRSKLTVDG